MRSGKRVSGRIIMAELCATLCLASGIAQNSFDSLLESGVKLAQQERYREAVQVFEKCVQKDPASFEAHYNLALALFAVDRLPEARHAIQAASEGRQSEQLAKQYLLGKIDGAL